MNPYQFIIFINPASSKENFISFVFLTIWGMKDEFGWQKDKNPVYFAKHVTCYLKY